MSSAVRQLLRRGTKAASGARYGARLFASLFLERVVEPPQHGQNDEALLVESLKPQCLKKLAYDAFIVLKELVPDHPWLIVRHRPCAMHNDVTLLSESRETVLERVEL
jgi:hypothetical protein